MARELTVCENPADGSFNFDIGPDHPDLVDRFHGKDMKVIGDPDDPDIGVVYDRKLGVFETNEEALRAAERYAAKRGVEIKGWHVRRQQSPWSDEPDMYATAY